MGKQISFDQAMVLIDNIKIQNRPTKKLFLAQTLGKTLAQDVVALDNSPAFLTSAMDGYAIKFEDQTLERIKIIESNPAGSVAKNSVMHSVCIKSFTGSLLPIGADTLIPIENVDVIDGFIVIKNSVPRGFAVRQVGENYKKNEVLIKQGTVCDFAEIGVMASLNQVYVETFCDVKVAICSTGSEILDIGEAQTNEAQIRSSNHITLEAIASKYGCETIQLGVVKDDRVSIAKAFQNALQTCDILVTTGGVSVGDYDFVKDVVKDELGADVIFQGVNMKPGQHVIIARIGDKFIASLPGFAYSSTVTFLTFVLPLVFKLQQNSKSLQKIEAMLEHDLPKKVQKAVFTACNIRYENGKYLVNTNGKKEGSSAILTNMLGDCALIFQNENAFGSKLGDTVEVVLF